jgi:hypothetical protein
MPAPPSPPGPFRIHGRTISIICDNEQVLGSTVTTLFAHQTIAIVEVLSGRTVYEGDADNYRPSQPGISPFHGFSPTQDLRALLTPSTGVEVVSASDIQISASGPSVVYAKNRPGSEGGATGTARLQGGPTRYRTPRTVAPLVKPLPAPPPRSHRPVILAVVVIVLAVTACALLLHTPTAGPPIPAGSDTPMPSTDDTTGTAAAGPDPAVGQASLGTPVTTRDASARASNRSSDPGNPVGFTDPFLADLLLHYPFTESSGDVLHDVGPHALHASVAGSASWVRGRKHGALELSGLNQYVTLPSGLFDKCAAMTVALWLNLPQSPANYARIFDFGRNERTNLFLAAADQHGHVFLDMYKEGGEHGHRISGPHLANGGWTHVAVTLTSKQAIIYVDGIAQGTSDAIVYSPMSFEPTSKNWLGRSQHRGDPFLHVIYDDVRIYARALSPADLAILMQLP